MDRHVARDQARRARSGAVAHRRLGGRLAHARVIGEAEVVVRAEQEHGLTVEQHARALRPGHAAHAPVQALVPDLVEPVLDVARHAAGSTWITSGYALGAPSGRGGTDVFFLCRSCVAGFQKFASCCESIRSSTGVRGLSPSSQPERLSGRGFAPLSSWRATFRPSSSNILRSHSGSEPSVVRKLPIITPFSPALTASWWNSPAPRFSLRPPQRRKSAPGMISRKMATHLTASQGSMSSRLPNFVPGRGLSRLIGTEVGFTSASWNAIS